MKAHSVALACAAGLLLAQSAGAQLPADAVPYKCAVIETSGNPGVIYFHAVKPAPERFVDLHLAADAGMTKADQARVQRVIECVRADQGFRNPDAQKLIRAMPPMAR
ncbi:MAG: hypothetical protein K9L70_09570 [Thiohalocapsa sp.]|nr:hypothetical protein [Thiohalocapsa sp.]MCF7990562.1 hypothetical protein [Thiohalocapsa sp.]